MAASKRSARCTCSRVKLLQTIQFVSRVVFYLFVATLFNLRSFWNWTYEPVGFKCNHPKAPVNNTGIKVLVYALAKTGTTQISNSLRELYPHTWHSEDFWFHLWSPLADEYWRRSENGGGMFPWQRLATPAPPAYMGHSFWNRIEHGADRIVYNNTPKSVLAERLSQCGVQAMAFDGIGAVFWDVLEMSPDAKVIIMNWRPFPAYEKSRSAFSVWVFASLLAINFCNVGMHVLPWNAVLLPVMDMLTGNTLLKFMESGRPLQAEVTWMMQIFRMSMVQRRFMQHYSSGLEGPQIRKESEYKAYWEDGLRRIPKHRRLEFSLKDNTMMDLCKFLGFKDHPACTTATIPKSGASCLTHMYSAPHHFVLWLPVFMFYHWVNYSLFWAVLSWVGYRLAAILKKSGVRLPHKKSKGRKSA